MLDVLRPKWLDVFLGFGLVSLWLYFARYEQVLDTMPAFAALWPNLTMDFFVIWMTARLIDGLISLRQRREQAVLRFRATINYTMQRVSDLIPEPRTWDLRALENETRWLEIAREKQGKYLKSDERSRVETAHNKLNSVVLAGRQLSQQLKQLARNERKMHDAFDAATRADRQKIYLSDVRSLNSLQQEFFEYRDDEAASGASLRTVAAQVRDDIANKEIDSEVREYIHGYLAAADVVLSQRDQLNQLVQEYIAYVRDSEMVLLKGVQF